MLKQVHEFIDLVFHEHLRTTQEFLRIPSITGNNPALIDTAIWLRNYLESLGGEVEFLGKKDTPIIFSQINRGKPRTLLIYGMYDVQPVEGQKWSSPPFGANIQTIQNIGPSIIARGACNSKGPLIGFLNTIKALKQVDEIPVNLIFTIEGEEEIGSPTLPNFYHENKQWLKSKVDAGFEPFWAEYGTDVDKPVISLGSKGIVNIELICRGGSWGGPEIHSVHSSVGAWLASPAWRLLKAVNTLLDDEENILIEGFDEEVAFPSVEDEHLLMELSKSFDGHHTLEVMGARHFKYKERGVDLLRKYLYTPSLQLGPLSHEGGDVIAREARIQLSVRLVPNMDPLRSVEKVRRHLSQKGYDDIEVVTLAHYPYSKSSVHEEVVQCMIETYRLHGVEPQIWPFSASATPYYLFSELLEIPFTWGGLGKAGKSHVADEFASVEGLKLFEKSIASFLLNFAGG